MKALQIRRKQPVNLLFLMFAGIYIVLYFMDFGCIFQRYFQIPCPGCGMTRAIRSVLHLDFKTAFYYHPMVFSLPILAGYVFTDGCLFKHKIANYTILILIGAGFIFSYIIKFSSF